MIGVAGGLLETRFVTTPKTPSPRSAWIDCAKAIGILLVVAGHNFELGREAPQFNHYVYLFHMPLFFVVSGLTYGAVPTWRTFGTRFFSIVIPFFLLSIAMIPTSMFLDRNLGVFDALAGIVYGSGFSMSLGAMWFLPCLALALLVAHTVLVALERLAIRPGARRAAVLFFAGSTLCLLGGLLLGATHGPFVSRVGWGDPETMGWPWNADVALVASGFVLVGVALREWVGKKLPSVSSIRQSGLGLLTALLLFGVLEVLRQRWIPSADLAHRAFSPLLVSCCTAFLGVAAVLIASFALTRFARTTRVLSLIGRSSLIILWLHPGLENHVARRLLGWMSEPVLLVVASMAFATLLPVLLDVLVIRRSRFLNRCCYPRVDVAQAFLRSSATTS